MRCVCSSGCASAQPRDPTKRRAGARSLPPWLATCTSLTPGMPLRTAACRCAPHAGRGAGVSGDGVVGLLQELDGLFDGAARTREPLLVDRQLVAAGVDGLAEALDGEVGELLGDALEPPADVVELSGHRP